MATRSAHLAAVLSFLIPGLGQLYNGERAKGISILCIALGIAFGILWSTIGPEAFRSWLSAIALGVLYPFIWMPAAIDACHQAQSASESLLSGRKRWYVIVLLLAVGPMAIPLLWQSPRFSRRAKVVWTIIVILVAFLAILSLVVLGPKLEQFLKEYSDLPRTLP